MEFVGHDLILLLSIVMLNIIVRKTTKKQKGKVISDAYVKNDLLSPLQKL